MRREKRGQYRPRGMQGVHVPVSERITFRGRRTSVAANSLHFRLALPAVLLGMAACQPTVKVEAPDKPIVINMNVKIEQEVRVKLERDVEELLKSQPELF